jgi:IclR family KDG regulon transcriptional repressor
LASSHKSIASIQRAVDILNLFNANTVELGNSEIARLSGLPRGTAAGIIYTLRINNYLAQNPANHKYRLGSKLAERASVFLDQIDLRSIASPYLYELRDWSGESANLAILDGSEVVYIERLYGHHLLGIRSELGKRAPFHSTSLGKAIAAYLPLPDLDQLLDNHVFTSLTQYTCTDRALFEKDLNRIRLRGYAVDDQENEVGGRCIGAPIFNHLRYPVAAISVSVPIQKLPLDQVNNYGQKLKTLSSEISKQIGYMNQP